jgi:hypothetical protein
MNIMRLERACAAEDISDTHPAALPALLVPTSGIDERRTNMG